MINHKCISHIKMCHRRITQNILRHESPKQYYDINVKTYYGLKAKTHYDLKVKHNMTWKSKYHVAKMPKHCQEFQEAPGWTQGVCGEFIPFVGVVPTYPYMSTAFPYISTTFPYISTAWQLLRDGRYHPSSVLCPVTGTWSGPYLLKPWTRSHNQNSSQTNNIDSNSNQ